MRSIVLAVVLALLGSAAHAQTPVAVDFATVSMTNPETPKLVSNSACYTDGRHFACDRGTYLLPGGIISTTAVSATALQLISPTTVTTCNGSSAGSIRYNSPTTTLELCTGSGWQPMGVGIPAGTISAFASTTCPVGWSEYTAARGRFLRGIDNGAGNDPDGTRSPGAAQADAMQNATGDFGAVPSGYAKAGTGVFSKSLVHSNIGTQNAGTLDDWAVFDFNLSRVVRTSIETRPKNIAVTFCQFNGTSNGWNNPLSAGSTVAAGSTGQLQYNTGNAFDASAGLIWTNASSLLTVSGRISATNISVTALTVNGVAITGGGGLGDRITSGTSAVAVNSATGIVSITQLGAVASYVHPSLGYVGPGISMTGTISAVDVKMSAAGGACATQSDEGRMMRNPTTGRLQMCRWGP